METPKKAAMFIARLLRWTQERKLEWRATEPPNPQDRTAYETYYEPQNRTLRIYQTQRDVSASEIFFREEPKFAYVTLLDVLAGGLVTYTFEGVSGLGDLYNSVSYSASRVEELMDAVLEDPNN